MNLAEKIIEKAEGKKKPFEAHLYEYGNLCIITKHQTGLLAYRAGQNWNMINKNHSFIVRQNGQSC